VQVTGKFCLDTVQVTGKFYLDAVQVTGKFCLDNVQATGEFYLDTVQVTGKFYLDTVQVSVEREEIHANTTKLKCDTNNLGNVHNLCILLSGSEGNRNRLQYRV
jgi:hypothetical protein